MYTAESPTTRDRTALLYHPLIGASNRESPAGITGHQKRPDRQKERQKGLQRPRWRLKCFYSDLRILSNGSQAILWHPAMSFAFLEDKQDKSIPTLDIRVLLLIGSG